MAKRIYQRKKPKNWVTIITHFRNSENRIKRVLLSSPEVAAVTRVRLIRTYNFKGIRTEGRSLILYK